MTVLTGGACLMDCLLQLGATRGFGVPGESYLAVLDAMHDRQAFTFVNCRNEGGAAFMAEAHGKLTGEPGLCFVTRGPGATNASIGVHTARQNSSPMILFVGQVSRDMIGREAFQEIDYRAYFGTVAKWVTEIDDAARIPEIVARAWATALSGRPGPVVVALPEDMLTDPAPTPALRPFTRPVPAPDAIGIDRTLDALAHAERPVAFIGGGGWRQSDREALELFADVSGLPVIPAFRFNDLLDNDHPAYAGEAGVGMVASVRRTLAEADLVLAVGVRFGENSTDGYTLFDVPNPRQTLVHVHPSDAELGKVYQPDIAIQSAPQPFFSALIEGGVPERETHWRDTARAAWLATFDLPDQPGAVDMGAVMRHLQETLPDNAILTNGAGNFAIWPNKLFRFRGRQRLLAPQSGAMGYGLPAAVAAKIERPDSPVICFAGDGDFQMNGTELGTAAQMGAAIVVLVVNNGSYGTIRMHQERHYPGRVSATRLVNPDFAALARAYGLHGERVERTHEFADAFARALASPTGAVLDLAVSEEAITPRQTLSAIRKAVEAAKA